MPKSKRSDHSLTPGQTYVDDDGEIQVIPTAKARQPAEAINSRRSESQQAHDDVRRAVKRLIRTGAPFKVTDVMAFSGRAKSFIYSHDGDGDRTCAICTNKDNLKTLAQEACRASRGEARQRTGDTHEASQASHRERANQAESLAKRLHRQIKEQDALIRDLKAQLRDPAGFLLVDRLRETNQENTKLRADLTKLRNTQRFQNRQIQAARENVIREQSRNVTQLHIEQRRTSKTSP